MHIQGAIDILKDKDFVLFGSEAFDVFEKTDIGAKVLIYASHDESEPVVSYVGIFEGIIGDPMEMRRLEKRGYRPKSTAGEKWGFYWKVKGIEPLDQPVRLSEVQLASGKYLDGYPRGPLHVLS
ncbi:hypothetical protein [Marinobacterium aestuariivivens]|uniref:Uncharacterized protein n=1 Tax=Marinobacterium aestuariivivens TaxID=1698799 RepID=A0ABW2A713_9GAMM